MPDGGVNGRLAGARCCPRRERPAPHHGADNPRRRSMRRRRVPSWRCAAGGGVKRFGRLRVIAGFGASGIPSARLACVGRFWWIPCGLCPGCDDALGIHIPFGRDIPDSDWNIGDGGFVLPRCCGCILARRSLTGARCGCGKAVSPNGGRPRALESPCSRGRLFRRHSSSVPSSRSMSSTLGRLERTSSGRARLASRVQSATPMGFT